MVKNEFNSEDIVGYKLKEVWYFDSETSKLGVRILGVAPIVNKYNDDGVLLHSAPMFWAYYPEMRSVLAQEETFNPVNDAVRLSWDDLFEARLFASHITKENNNLDRRIKDYIADSEKQLLEAEKIEESIRNFEHDQWSY